MFARVTQLWRGPRSLILPALLFAVWQVRSWLGWLPEGIVPTPEAVARSWYTWIFGASTHSLSPYSGT